MSESRLPGIKCKHAIITPNCRVVQGGPMEAFDEAVRRLKMSYADTLQYDVNAQADFHLVLTVDRPTQRAEEVS